MHRTPGQPRSVARRLARRDERSLQVGGELLTRQRHSFGYPLHATSYDLKIEHFLSYEDVPTRGHRLRRRGVHSQEVDRQVLSR